MSDSETRPSMRPMLSAFAIGVILTATAVAQQSPQRETGPRAQNQRPAVIKQKTPLPTPRPEPEQPSPPDQPPVAAASPPQPPQPIIVPAPQVTVMGPSNEGWLGWALLGLGLLFTGVFAIQTWLGRHGLQLSVDYDKMFEDAEFKKRLSHYVIEHSEENAVQQLLSRIEARSAAPALHSNRRGEH